MAFGRTANPKVYQIAGAGISFSSNTDEFDRKAAESICRINEIMGRNAVQVRNNFLEREPEVIPGDRLFLFEDPSGWYSSLPHPPNGEWKNYGSAMGYAIRIPNRLGSSLKASYVYHKGNKKTNWIMNIYTTIYRASYVKTSDVYLCHVFQSNGNYDPRPKHVEPNISVFFQATLQSRVGELESLIRDPNSFVDFDEGDDNSTAYWTGAGNGSSGKRSEAWKDFTKIKVLDPDGVTVLTFAICHHCNIAYKTGSLDTKLGFKCNGTKTLKNHLEKKCCGQPRIAGNPNSLS